MTPPAARAAPARPAGPTRRVSLGGMLCTLLVPRTAACGPGPSRPRRTVPADGQPDPHGRGDSAPALNRALAGLGAAGGRLHLPKGDYLLRSPLVLRSNTTLTGTRARLFTDLDDEAGAGFAFVTNERFLSPDVRDHGLSIEGLSFDFGALSSPGTHAIRIRKARGVLVRGCAFRNGNDATAFLACTDTTVEGCTAAGVTNCAWDHWEHPRAARVLRSTAVLSGPGAYGILWTGLNTELTVAGDASGLLSQGNVFHHASQAVIWAEGIGRAGDQHASSSGVVSVGDRAYGGSAPFFVASGEGRAHRIRDGRIEGMSGGALIRVSPDPGCAIRDVDVDGFVARACTTPDAMVAALVMGGEGYSLRNVDLAGNDYPLAVWSSGREGVIETRGLPPGRRGRFQIDHPATVAFRDGGGPRHPFPPPRTDRKDP